MNPNEAFRDRNKKHDKKVPYMIKFTGTSKLVWFLCRACDHEFNSVFHDGMTMFTKNLRCPSCLEGKMDYTIDP